MATIDLIVLGMLKKEPMGAYAIQKLVEYRNISKWVKISTPSIYKKAIQLEEKGFIKADIVKEGKMPEKAVYSLTSAGEKEFERLMFEIAAKPIQCIPSPLWAPAGCGGFPRPTRIRSQTGHNGRWHIVRQESPGNNLPPGKAPPGPPDTRRQAGK